MVDGWLAVDALPMTQKVGLSDLVDITTYNCGSMTESALQRA